MNRPLALINAVITAVCVYNEFWGLATFAALFTLMLCSEIAGGND